MLGLIVLAASMAFEAGGVMPVLKNTPSGFFNFFSEWESQAVLAYVGSWITLGLGSLPSQDIFQLAMSSKSEKVAKHSSILAPLIYLCISILPLYIALSAKFLYPELSGEDQQASIPNVVIHKTNLFIQIIFFGSLLSAILSTTSAAILAPASVLSENLIKPHFNNKLSDSQFLLILRISVIVIAGLSCYMALLRSNIYELVSESSALTLVSLFIPMIAAIYIRQAGKYAAIFSMSSGMISWLIFTGLNFSIALILPALGVGILMFLLGLLIDLKINT